MKRIFLIISLLFCSIIFSSCVFGHVQSGLLVETEYEAQDNVDKFEIRNVSARTNSISSFGPMVRFHKSNSKRIVMSFQESMANEIKVTYENGKMLISSNLITVYFTDYEISIDIYGYEFKEVTANSAASLIFEEGTLPSANLDVYLSGASSFEAIKLDIDKINVEASGASRVYFPEIKANEMKIKLSGASELLVEKMEAQSVVYDGSGASSFNVTGSTSNLDLKLSGASKIKSFDFIVDKTTVIIEGASEVEMSVTSSISGRAKGGSTIVCKGRPSVSVETQGGSSVKTVD